MIQVRYYLPPRNAVLRETPLMAIYKDGERVFKGRPIDGVWMALELAGVETKQQRNEIFPDHVDRPNPDACGCKRTCGDLPEDEDKDGAQCKGLPR